MLGRGEVPILDGVLDCVTGWAWCWALLLALSPGAVNDKKHEKDALLNWIRKELPAVGRPGACRYNPAVEMFEETPEWASLADETDVVLRSTALMVDAPCPPGTALAGCGSNLATGITDEVGGAWVVTKYARPPIPAASGTDVPPDPVAGDRCPIDSLSFNEMKSL